ncbi:MAG: tetratricopeptide repeat protein, partial [Candidatus Thorarchaeota archaeon]
EERKCIDEIAAKTKEFFDSFNIIDEQVKFRFLNNLLHLDYSKVKSILKNEEDYYKILLFISINHPDFYPDYQSLEDFSRYYDIKKRTLDFWVNEIVDSNLYDLQFFKLEPSSNHIYYFHSDEKLEKILRAITEEHITVNKYLEKFGSSGSLNSIIDDILEELCNTIFDKHFRESLREFLLGYIKHLAYKIEKKKELIESYDKLEGIIWQDMIDILQSHDPETLESHYDKIIKNIDKDINLSPNIYNLYNSKLRILLYFNQYDDALIVLKKMKPLFPEKEIDIMIKKAYTLKRDKKLQEGLDIIDNLIKKYPENDLLFNYKAYWLSYLGKKEETLEILQRLTKNKPKKGIYHDTYGEILMAFKDYEQALEEFQKAIELNTNNWFIYQTYIKIGICYTALEKFELAIQNLGKGKDMTGKIITDLDSKRKWLAIANLFLAEIKEQEQLTLTN